MATVRCEISDIRIVSLTADIGTYYATVLHTDTYASSDLSDDTTINFSYTPETVEGSAFLIYYRSTNVYTPLDIDESTTFTYGDNIVTITRTNTLVITSYINGDTVTTSTAPSGSSTVGAVHLIILELSDGVWLANVTSRGKSYSDVELNTDYIFPYFTITTSSDSGALVINSNTLTFGAVLQGTVPADDPYENDGASGTGGGTGDLDGTSDSIDIPDLPSLSAVDTGLISLFNPTLAQVQSLASYLWSDLFDLDTFKKMFNDPMDCILGLSIVPVDVPSGDAREITVGNIVTTVSMNIASSQYVEIDCGTLNVNEYWGSFADYSPATKCQIYLPYCGTHDLNTDDVMGKAVQVVYHIDILTGACTAFVKCGNSVLYEFNGNCAVQIPITNSNYASIIGTVTQIGVAVGGALATGGMSAPLAISQVGSLAGSTINGGMKPNVKKSGSMAGNVGLLGVQTPYLILTRPNMCIPSKQNTYVGYPSYITETLSNLSGYTEIYSIHLEGMSGTDAEVKEIEELLKTGVIF